jgi:hypothetical protein
MDVEMFEGRWSAVTQGHPIHAQRHNTERHKTITLGVVVGMRHARLMTYKQEQSVLSQRTRTRRNMPMIVDLKAQGGQAYVSTKSPY